VKASVIQGSGLGPASFTITAADLCPVRAENRIFKFADDTYLVVPASNICSRSGMVKTATNQNGDTKTATDCPDQNGDKLKQ